ncbi:beta-hexosaminidase [Pyrenophora tritici-repentis Pt-1C-BFP]|uniref:Beta-hexosaminidase n=1 Tax=Pyrenophora tritici-repentis (strain Pt-1C-BFP) TaxID=426418 RepID=B2WEZ1_PYRTR|nr:beta-hexosaminidase [Pyrenophora tritici-repentis Pt-1C-BFP]EDU51071.1 beta-hexosaminidase [Pyrenophora tritici-repentis Pt-1C-BFP]
MGGKAEKMDPVWDDLDRTMVGRFRTKSVAAGFANEAAEDTTKLIYELQKIAHDAGHPVPLAIGIDQENGGVNSLFDDIYIRQYPSNMGMAATGSTDLAFEVAKSTAQEIAACGINWIFGPCLDVLTNARNQPLGVRTAGDDPQEVSAFGVAFMQGYKDAGVVTLGKHFPSYGNLEFLGSTLDVPIITESLEQLSLSALIPFKRAIEKGLDSMMVGGCAMSSAGLNAMHACLSEQVVDELLRKDLNFDGVVVSECLEMDALSHNIGVGGGTVMAVNAGCDVVLLCRSFSLQQEGLKGLKTGIEGEMVSKERIFNSLRRVLAMKKKYANRNLYQHGFTKHVSMICNTQYTTGGERREKPLIVVAVSSPYDFAMDTSIGTYICTYDFTETALNSLVRVLYGEMSPSGTLPGTISKSQKLHPSKQHWLVEIFNEERDGAALDTLVTAVVESTSPNQRSELSSATSSSFILHHPEVEESHFVVRNSSTQALYGFCSTYFFKATGTGVIGALFVDPARRKLSIGHSLHNRAIRTLLQKEGVKRFQLGSRLPSMYLGIPTGHGNERKRLRSWFAQLGWGAALSRPVCNMVARNLQTWSPPPGMAKSLASAGAQFDLVYGWDYAGPILDHIKTSNRQGLAEVYKLALTDPTACGIIRAKRPEDGALVGTVVLYNNHSRLAEYIPPLKDLNEAAGGISSPVISPGVGEYSTLLQGLILLGMRQIKQLGCNACLLDYMDGDGNFDGFSAMGFDVMHNFEEVSCDAATWTMIPPA